MGSRNRWRGLIMALAPRGKGCISHWIRSVLQAEGASCTALQIPRSPYLTGRDA